MSYCLRYFFRVAEYFIRLRTGLKDCWSGNSQNNYAAPAAFGESPLRRTGAAQWRKGRLMWRARRPRPVIHCSRNGIINFFFFFLSHCGEQVLQPEVCKGRYAAAAVTGASTRWVRGWRWESGTYQGSQAPCCSGFFVLFLGDVRREAKTATEEENACGKTQRRGY